VLSRAAATQAHAFKRACMHCKSAKIWIQHLIRVCQMLCRRQGPLPPPASLFCPCQLHAAPGPLKYSPFCTRTRSTAQRLQKQEHIRTPNTAFVYLSGCCPGLVLCAGSSLNSQKNIHITQAASYLLHNSVGRQHLLPLSGVLCTAAECCYSICHDRQRTNQRHNH
jgi:hypothetical protein